VHVYGTHVTDGDKPLFFVLELRPADTLKVTLPGMGALTRWYVASKTHYPLERDSVEVP